VELRDNDIGRCVWAAVGGYGWRPASVVALQPVASGGHKVRLQFETGRKGGGQRHSSQLLPRDPTKRGKDKPRPPHEQPPDVQTWNHGSIVEFLPLTARGRAWVKTYTGGETTAEHRYGIDILQGMLDAGLVLIDGRTQQVARPK